MTTRRSLLIGLGSLILLPVSGCHRQPEPSIELIPQPIADDAECQVCGMIVNRFPGPKGELLRPGRPMQVFCSTRDLFAYLVQPDSRTADATIYVHDMGATDWFAPTTEALTEARQAHYVICQPLPGAMGPTLAPFRDLAAAEAFAARYRGRVLAFDQIDTPLITALSSQC